MKVCAILPLLCLGCVVRYGTPEVSPVLSEPRVPDLALTDLDARVGLLLAQHPEEAQAARLEAARALLRKARTWGAAERDALAGYLRVVVASEERTLSVTPVPILAPQPPVLEESPDGGIPPAGGVVEEVLDAPSPAVGAGSGGGNLEMAPTASDLDTWVRSERELAGRLFLEARALTDPDDRRRGLEEVRDRLASLLATCPDTRYAEAIRRNLATVERELEKGP